MHQWCAPDSLLQAGIWVGSDRGWDTIRQRHGGAGWWLVLSGSRGRSSSGAGRWGRGGLLDGIRRPCGGRVPEQGLRSLGGVLHGRSDVLGHRGVLGAEEKMEQMDEIRVAVGAQVHRLHRGRHKAWCPREVLPDMPDMQLFWRAYNTTPSLSTPIAQQMRHFLCRINEQYVWVNTLCTINLITSWPQTKKIKQFTSHAGRSIPMPHQRSESIQRNLTYQRQ